MMNSKRIKITDVKSYYCNREGELIQKYSSRVGGDGYIYEITFDGGKTSLGFYSDQFECIG
ncbi:hypothetical protein [Paenibacillus chitinolyticus]|uniref:hypothetical protein n=1 Tax=Paenibacillus chitinolyticus TaxID=79263 RepID=UPI00366C86A5